MANFLPPPANAPIGFWRDTSGRLVQVFPSRELAKFFETNFSVTDNSTVTNITEETDTDISGSLIAELTKRVGDLETDSAADNSALVAELSKRADDVDAWQVDSLLAQVSEMAKRIEALETELMAAQSLNAQVAQLAKRINEIEIEAM